MLRVISVPASALPDMAGMPEGTTVIGVHCEHLERPFFATFPPPDAFAGMPGLAALFGAESPEPGPPLSLIVMKHQAVSGWGQQLTCGCVERWWAQHGPRLVVLPHAAGEQDHNHDGCEHDGSVITRCVSMERN